MADVSIFVLPGPREKFTENEFNTIKKYLDSGGNVLVMLGEGGEKMFQTNINFLLEEYGIMINNGEEYNYLLHISLYFKNMYLKN